MRVGQITGCGGGGGGTPKKVLLFPFCIGPTPACAHLLKIHGLRYYRTQRSKARAVTLFGILPCLGKDGGGDSCFVL